MSKTKILKFILIIILSYFLSTILKSRLNISYDSVTLGINIEFFDTDQSALAHRKLHTLPLYGTIAMYFTPKKMAVRLNNKIQRSLICERDPHAKKRHPNLKPEETSININMIFLTKINAQKCLEDIESYIEEQKKLFITESSEIISRTINKQKIISIEQKKNNNTDIEDILDSYFLEEFKDENSINEYLRILKLKSIFSESYNLKEFMRYYSIVEKSKIFTINSKIQGSSNEIAKNLKIEFLFLFFVALLFLIFYRKEIEIYFKKLKNKI